MQSTLFTQGPLPKRLFIFSLPLMAINILQYLYQFVDMAVVGIIEGEIALVALSNAASIAFVINSLVIGLTTGGGVAIARAVGAGDLSEQRRSFAATLIVSMGAALLIASVGIFGSPSILRLMGIAPEALDDAVAYITIISVGSLCSFVLNTVIALLRAQGNSMLPFAFIGVSALCNAALDILFVTDLGLGVVGAAWATVISQGLAALAALIFTRSKYPASRGLRQAIRHSIYPAVAAVLRVGLPSAIQYAVINLSYVLVTALLNGYGPDVAAASGVGLKVSTLAGLPCWAIGSAITTASAQCVGAGNQRRALSIIKIGLAFNIGVIVVVQIMIQLCAVQLVSMLGASSKEVVETSVLYLRITCSINGLFYAAMYSFDSFALGAGSPKLVLVNSLIDAFVGRFGLALLFSGLLIPAMDFGYVGIYVAQALAPVLPAVIGGVYAVFWRRGLRQ